MRKHTLCILAAGTLWGFMGLFVRSLAAAGIRSTGAVLLRCTLAAAMFAVTLAVKNPALFRVRVRDFWCFIGSGLCSLLFFTYCYFKSMEYLDLSTAAILLYTAPSIVIVLSRAIFREKLTPVKIAALLLAFTGCCLVSGAGTGSALPAKGILLGLGSGFGYALYSIFARLSMNRGYHSLTVNFYTCLLAALGAALVWGPGPFRQMVSAPGTAALSLAAACVTCYLPYLLYTYGLSGTETGKASIMASVEPVVATLLGVLVYRESMSAGSFFGTLLVLSAIVLLNVKIGKNQNKE